MDVAQTAGVGRTPKSGMNASLGDVFNDGRPAIYKTNISEPGVLVQGNDLWVPARRGATAEDSAVAFENLASGLGVDLGGWSWGAQFGDLNNDGTQDLYLTNGYVSAGERSSYWYDFSVIAVGHSTIIGDAANWPAMRGRSLSGYQRKRVWLNDGLGTFTEVAQSVGVTDAFDGRAVALADFDNDGALDVVVANQKGPLLLYRNTVDPTRHWIDFRAGGRAQQPQRHRRTDRVALGRQGAAPGSGGGQRVQRPEPAAPALRPWRRHAGRARRDHLALGSAGHAREPRAGPRAPGQGAVAMSWLRLDNRYLPPLLITAILLTAHFSFGILEGPERTGLAIATAIVTELVLGRVTYGVWVHPASAYITGISVGILLRSPFLWPYFLCSFISILSKYVLRIGPKHLWNPSNLGVSLVLLLAPETVSLLSVQWGNVVAPMVVIWLLGSVIVYRVGRFHLSATYVASFLAFSVVRSMVTGTPWLANVAPITGPMYQLFIFFMVTDPKTAVGPKWAQCLVVFVVAFVEMVLRLNEVVYAPFYALALVGPSALLIEAALKSARQSHEPDTAPAGA